MTRSAATFAALPLLWMLGVGGCASEPGTAVHAPLDVASAGSVRRADAARRTAQVAADPALLAETLDDALLYVHSDGRAETKAEFIASLTEGGVDYLEIRPERSGAFLCRGLPHGDGPCVISEQTLVVRHEGALHTIRNCATAAYRAGALVHYVSRPLPESGRCELP